MFNVTDSGKDELDVSMTAHRKRIVYSKPTNAGLSKINICDYDEASNTCTISVLPSGDNQRQASITGNGAFIVLVRDLVSPTRWRILRYEVATGIYTIVVTRQEELSHPSSTANGEDIMYLRDRTASVGKYLIRIKNLITNIVDNEVSKANLGHPHARSTLDFLTYRDDSNNGTRAFTRNINTNDRASAQGGNYDYFQPYWQENYCGTGITVVGDQTP